MKKTILFIPGFVCDTWSTIENYTIELTKVLSDDFNIIWLVPTINNPYNKFKNENCKANLKEPIYVTEAKKNNIQIITADLSKFNLIKNLFVLNKIFKENKVNAVYTEFGFKRYVATICSKLLGKKTIFRAHGHMGGKFKFFKLIIYSLFMDVFLPVSYYVQSFVPKFKKSVVVQNPVEIIDYEKPSREELISIKKELGLEKFENIVVMISAFNKTKRHYIALDIIKKVKKKAGGKIGFVFLGAGELYEYYLTEIKKEQLGDLIIMPGYTTRVNDYLKISDISILTSLEEGLPCSFLESMNYKLPLIAFNTGWAKELITQDVNGCLVNIDNTQMYADIILNLVNNVEKRKEYGENSYSKLKENFSIESWRKKMKKTFTQIMNGHSYE